MGRRGMKKRILIILCLIPLLFVGWVQLIDPEAISQHGRIRHITKAEFATLSGPKHVLTDGDIFTVEGETELFRYDANLNVATSDNGITFDLTNYPGGLVRMYSAGIVESNWWTPPLQKQNLPTATGIKDGDIMRVETKWGFDEYKYDANDTTNVNLGPLVLGPESVGRFKLQSDIIRPEFFGAVADGVTDDHAALQAWADAARQYGSQYKFYADQGAYYTTETVVFHSVIYREIKIGITPYDRRNAFANEAKPGIVYGGPAGVGPEPNNITPIVLFRGCGFLNIPVLTAYQIQQNTPAANIAAMLIVNNNSERSETLGLPRLNDSQAGNIHIDTWYLANCDYSLIAGLHDFQEGQWGPKYDASGNPLSGGNWNDDCFEKYTVVDATFVGSRTPMVVSAATSDSTKFENLMVAAYRPVRTDHNFGPTDKGVQILTSGKMTFDKIEAGHLRFGERFLPVIPIGDFDDTTDVVTSNGHGMSDGDAITIDGAQQIGNIEETQAYYVVNSTINTFQFSETVGGAPVDFDKNVTPAPTDQLVSVLGDNHAVIFNQDSLLDIRSMNVETTNALVLEDAGTGTGRNVTRVGNLNTSINSKNKDGVCVVINRPVDFYNSSFPGDVHYRNQAYFTNCYFADLNAKYVNTGSERAGLCLINTTNTDGTALWMRDRHQSIMPYAFEYGFGTENHKSQVQYSLPANNAVIEGFNSGAIVSNGHTFNNDDLVTIVGNIPTGAKSFTRYKVTSVVPNEFSLVDMQDNAVPVSTTTGGTVRQVIDVAYYDLKPSTAYTMGFIGRVHCRRASVVNDGSMSAIVSITAGQNSDDSANSATVSIDNLTAIDNGVGGMTLTGAATFDQDRISISLGAVNNDDFPQRTIVEWSVLGFEGNNAITPAIQFMKESHGFRIIEP